MRTAPFTQVMGVSRCPLPGNLKRLLVVETSGNCSLRRAYAVELLPESRPVTADITSRTLTLGGVSQVLRICRTESGVRLESAIMRSGMDRMFF